MFATASLFLDCGFIIPQDKAFFCDEVTLLKKSGAFFSTGLHFQFLLYSRIFISDDGVHLYPVA